MDCDNGRYTTSEALKLFREQMDDDRIATVVISYVHVDHHGDIEGLIGVEDVTDVSLLPDEQIVSGKTAVIVPRGFIDTVMKKSALIGTAIKYRVIYQHGSFLPYHEQGRLPVGIGLTAVQGGTDCLISTYEIIDTLFGTEIDGVKAVSQLTPDMESPAEMNMYLPDKQALWMAENCVGTMHNLYTLCGAEVRDANDWARYIMQVQMFFSDAEAMFQSYNWSHWGADVVQEYLTNTAAAYKFIYDRALLYINQDYTATEIAAAVELSEASDKVWYTRQHYGTFRHSVRAIYRKYMNWYDVNLVRLGELEPSEYAKKLVEYLDDPEEVLEQARTDYREGEYQWVTQITNILVFTDSENMDARHPCADALEQLSYQVESSARRNAYLAAAYELRNGTGSCPQVSNIGAGTTVQDMNAQMMLDYIGIVLDTEKLVDASSTIRLKLADDEDYFLKFRHGILLHYKDDGTVEVGLTLSTVCTGILVVANSDQKNITKFATAESGDMTLSEDLCTSMATPELYFSIIEL